MKRLFSMTPIHAALVALAALSAAAPPAAAQFFGGRSDQPQQDNTAGLLLRIDRLENQVRSLNGQLEQMQFQLRRSEEQMRKFQQDVEFRFQEQQGGKGGARPQTPPAQAAPPQRRSDLEPEAAAPNDQIAEIIPAPAMVPRGAGGATPRSSGVGAGRGDAFDPNANPEAPGAPRPLGSPASASTPLARSIPSGPLGAENDPNAPLDLMGSRRRESAGLAPVPPGAMAGVTPSAPAAASLPATTPRDEFDLAVFSLEQGQFDQAEMGLKGFLQRYPQDRMAGEAVYYLGESYFKRGKHRDAAEQFLKISTDYPKTAHAPDAMLRLGLSLEKLGAKEQACAFYAEVPRKFPSATAAKTGAQREAKRAQC